MTSEAAHGRITTPVLARPFAMSTPPAIDRSPPPVQFGLRTLFIGTAVCAVLILVLQQIGAAWGTLVVWLLLLAAAHVVANVRGARLRGSPTLDEESEAHAPVAARIAPLATGELCAPATQLRD